MVSKALRRPAAPKRSRPPRGPGRFTEREVARALRAARRAGGVVDRVEVDPASGRIAVILAKPKEADAATDILGKL